MGLTTNQKAELNTAILEYLIKNNYPRAAEAQVSLPDDKISSVKYKDLLEKKWTSVVRLKK